MNGTPDLNLLPLFVAVAETWSMSAAARALELPKSSVSRGIAALEASLKVQLFHRTTRKVALTTAGTAFYERVKPVVASLKDITGSLPEQEAEPAGELRISAPMDLALTVLPSVVAQFATRHPGVQLDVRPSNRVVDLVAEGYDAALRMGGTLADSTLRVRKIAQLEIGLFASASYVARKGQPRSPNDACDHDWVVLAQMKMPGSMARHKKPKLLTDDVMFALGAIREGRGIGLLPAFLTRDDVATGRLLRVVPKWDQRGSTLFFVHPQTEHVPRKVAAFRDFVLTYFNALPLTSAGQ